MESQENHSSPAEISRMQQHSEFLFKLTCSLGVLFLGSFVSMLSTPIIDNGVAVRLGLAALVFIAIGSFMGAWVHWGRLSNGDRNRLVFYGQISTLIFSVACVVFAGVSIAFPDQPQASADEVEPIVRASSSVSVAHEDSEGNSFTYVPNNTIDENILTSWRVPGAGKGEWIELAYTKPVAVETVGVVPGHDKVDPDGTDRFFQLHVIKEASIEFSNGRVEKVRFDPRRDMQFTSTFDPPVITESVRIRIEDTYPPGSVPGSDRYPYLVDETAVSEIEIR